MKIDTPYIGVHTLKTIVWIKDTIEMKRAVPNVHGVWKVLIPRR